MPGILKRPSFEQVNSIFGRGDTEKTDRSSPKPTSPASNMERAVQYVPPQMDPLSTTSTRVLQSDPFKLLMQDLQAFIKALPYAPQMFLPTRNGEDKDEMSFSVSTMKTYLLQSLLIIYEAAFATLAIPAMLCLPGFFFMTFAIAGVLMARLLAWPLNGSRIIYSRMDKLTKASAKHHRHERWVFVNGLSTSRDGLQSDIDRVSRVFGRPVMGIHNKTFGFIADVAGCLMQRVLAYNPESVRVTHDQIKAMLCDPTIVKVVLMGHSSGGMVISMVLDHLYDEVLPSDMAKLEIYTFGSAASYFMSPRLSRSATLRNNSDRMTVNRDYPYIEHYANEQDMISRWGVLYGAREVASNRYGGAVFLRNGISGHQFSQHYLNPMFGNHWQSKTADPDRPEITWLVNPFLDKMVTVDDQTVARREGAALEKIGIMRRESGMEFGSVQHLADGAAKIGNGNLAKPGDLVMAFERTASGRLVTEEARGKSVRELSRLWRYIGGTSPDGPAVNGYHHEEESK